jgi:hypothetical protein
MRECLASRYCVGQEKSEEATHVISLPTRKPYLVAVVGVAQHLERLALVQLCKHALQMTITRTCTLHIREGRLAWCWRVGCEQEAAQRTRPNARRDEEKHKTRDQRTCGKERGKGEVPLDKRVLCFSGLCAAIADKLLPARHDVLRVLYVNFMNKNKWVPRFKESQPGRRSGAPFHTCKQRPPDARATAPNATLLPTTSSDG